MKKVLLLFIFILQYNSMESQAFFVGDTSCIYIKINKTFLPDASVYQAVNERFPVDIDGDNINDMKVYVYCYHYVPNPSQGGNPYHVKRISIDLINNIEFICSVPSSSVCNVSSPMVQKLSYGAVISSSLNWYSAPSFNGSNVRVRTYIDSPYNECGDITTSFYCGFRKVLPGNDTLYGWLLLDTSYPYRLISYGLKSTSIVNTSITNTITTTCSGNSINLTSNPPNGFFIGNGVTGNTFNSSITGSGSHQVYVSDGCKFSDTLNINVLQSPTPQITNTISTVCYGDQMILQAIPSGGTFNGSGITGSVFNSFNANLGANVINYSVTAPNGCSGITTVTLNVETVKITASNNNTIACAGSGIYLYGNPTGGFFSGTGVASTGISPGSTGTFSSSIPGLYTAYYTYTNSLGCNATSSLNVSVVPSPVVAFTNTRTTCCGWDILPLTAQPPGGVIHSTYGISGATTPGGDRFYAPNFYYGPTVVTYSYYNSFGCNATATITVQGINCDSIHQDEDSDVINIFPNPVSDKFNITIKNYSIEQNLILSIISVNGKFIKLLPISKAETEINVEDINPGIYIIQIDSSSGTTRKKLVIAK
jgi:hypothetical protein